MQDPDDFNQILSDAIEGQILSNDEVPRQQLPTLGEFLISAVAALGFRSAM